MWDTLDRLIRMAKDGSSHWRQTSLEDAMAGVYRADVVGSLLRPEYLKRARQQWREGSISVGHLKRLEDCAVDQAIALQEGVGMDVLTDGEMRREIFSDHVFKELHGLSDIPSPPLELHKVDTGESVNLSMPRTVTGKISRKRMLSLEEFVYARAKSRLPVKATVSSPLLLNFLWSPDHSPQAYADPYDLFRDATAIIREEVVELAALGCQYIQVDAPEIIQVLADDSQRKRWESVGLSPDWVVPEGIELLNSIADPIPGVTFALHVCRANAPSMYLASGGYGTFAEKIFPLATNYHVFSLEYDDERSGDFEPLGNLPDDKMAALGLVSTKVDTVEDPDEVEKRLHEAAQYADLDRLALSTQCGFASMEAGNQLSLESQEAKLRVVADVAQRTWS